MDEVLKKEADQGLLELETYVGFTDKVNKIKNDLLSFLIEQKRSGNKL